MKIEGVEKVRQALIKKAAQYGKPDELEGLPSVAVGYSAHYALTVHENLESHHNVGQAKYLEQPAREYKDELAGVVVRAVKGGATLLQGLYLAGLRLQRESQKIVPIDTGNLRGSAFTVKEK